MHIAIDATARLHGGGWLYLRRLLACWREDQYRDHRFTVFTRHGNASALQGEAPEWAKFVDVISENCSNARRLMWQQLKFPSELKARGVDVLFCPANIGAITRAVPSVVTIHNAAPFSEHVTLSSEGLVRWVSFKVLGDGMKRSVAVASRTIFLSEYLRDKFIDNGYSTSVNSDRIYLGRDADVDMGSKWVATFAVHAPYLLSVSHVYPYKNLPALVSGYALQRQVLQNLGLKLLIVGKAVDRAETEKIQRIIRQHGLEQWVILTGAVPPEAIPSLMKLSHAVVFQSTCENCPSTLIEALNVGSPIASSSVDPMPEIAGDAAHYFDPFDAKSIGNALVRISTDESLRKELTERTTQQIKMFPTWSHVAELTMDAFEQAVGENALKKRSVTVTSDAEWQPEFHPEHSQAIKSAEYFSSIAHTWSSKYVRRRAYGARLEWCIEPVSKCEVDQTEILDFGCGTGDVAAALCGAGFRVTAVDCARAMVEEARRRLRGTSVSVEFLPPAPWVKLPYADGAFNAVIASSVLEYVEDPASQIHEIARVIKNGGIFVCTVPDPKKMLRRIERPMRALLRIDSIRKCLRLLLPQSFLSYGSYLDLSVNRFGLDVWCELLGGAGLTISQASRKNLSLARLSAVKLGSEQTGEEKEIAMGVPASKAAVR